MIGLIKNIFITLFKVFNSVVPLSKRLRLNNLTVLLYHEVSPETFEKHLEYICKHYNFVTLSEVKEWKYNSKKQLPKNSIWITFDDGWKSNYLLLSLIQKYSFKPTIFIPSELVFTNRKIWNFSLDRKKKDGKVLNNYLKSIENSQKNDFLIKHNSHTTYKEYPDRDFINKVEFEEMKEYIDFQSHTRHHPVLTKCSTAELTDELEGSKYSLEKMIGQDCLSIAYPYGIYNNKVMETTKDTGYMLGRIANKPGLVQKISNPYEIRSIDMRDTDSVNDLKRNILWAELKTLLKQ